MNFEKLIIYPQEFILRKQDVITDVITSLRKQDQMIVSKEYAPLGAKALNLVDFVQWASAIKISNLLALSHFCIDFDPLL